MIRSCNADLDTLYPKETRGKDDNGKHKGKDGNHDYHNNDYNNWWNDAKGKGKGKKGKKGKKRGKPWSIRDVKNLAPEIGKSESREFSCIPIFCKFQSEALSLSPGTEEVGEMTVRRVVVTAAFTPSSLNI